MNHELSTDDIIEITQVVHLYGHILDGRLWHRLSDVFTDDGVFDMSLEKGTSMGGRRFDGIAELRAMFDVVDHALAHHVSNVYVYERGGHVRALCKFFMPDTLGRFHTGEYADRLVRTERGWRIKHRMIKERRYFAETIVRGRFSKQIGEVTPWTRMSTECGRRPSPS